MTRPAEVTDLVGRDAERALLRAGLDGRGPRCLLLQGEPGIGKTALLDALGAEATRAGRLVLRTAGVAVEQGLPYAGLQQLFAPLLADLPGLPAPQRAALGVALGLEAGAPSEVFLVALACLGLLAGLPRSTRVVLLVDDVPWLDLLTHVVVTFLARRLDDRMVLVGAARSGYEGGLRDVAEVVELGPLDDGAVDRLLARSAPAVDGPGRRDIGRRARGNPLALIELSTLPAPGATAVDDLGEEPLTRTLEQAFAGWVPTMGAALRDVVSVAACYAGEDLPTILDAASRLAGHRIGPVDLHPGTASRLVDLSASTLRFRHPLVRSAIMGVQVPSRRVAVHAALAASLDRDACLRAWHRANATVVADDEVADELGAAAELLVARGSASKSVVYLEKAARLTVDPVVAGHRYVVAAERAVGVGGAAPVRELITAARGLPISDLDRLRLELVREMLDEGEPGDAHRVRRLSRHAREASAQGDDDLALRLLFAAAVHCWWTDPGAAVRQEVADTVAGLGRRRGDPRQVAVLAVAQPVEATAVARDLLSDFAPTEVDDGQALRLLGLAAYAIGDSPRAQDYLHRAENRLRAGGELGALVQVLMTQVGIGLFTGDWAAAAGRVEESRSLGRDVGQPVWESALLVGRAQLAGLRGDLPQALELAGRAERAAGAARTNNLLAGVQLARGAAFAAAGRFADAFAELRRLFDPAAPCHHVRQSYPAIMFLAESARYAQPDHVTEARGIVDGFAALAATTPSPDLHVHLAYARAVLADDAGAEDAYRTALDGELDPWPFVRAMTELAYGTWLRRQRRAVESRRPTRSALATFEHIGARGWVVRGRSGLAAAGERPDTPSRPVHELLTAQQYQIARLAAQGLSNKEIGEQLFLSARTVGSHLYRIFPKVGVTSRIQLVERLRTDGPDPS